MKGSGSVAAVDLGASSGRVVLGRLAAGRLSLEEVARFDNQPVRLPLGERLALHTDAPALFERVCHGLGRALRTEPALASIGVDCWAVDYGLLRGGELLGLPFHYRDDRTAAGVEAVHARVDAAELYRATGLQHLAFNTVFQLAEDAAAGRLTAADRVLLLPDLFTFWLSGVEVTELSNASTTALLDPRTRRWHPGVLADVGLDASLLAPLVEPGQSVGELRGALLAVLAPDVARPPLVTAVGSHDTASAVVGVPAEDEAFGYVSSGTWSLVGVELAAPVLSEAGRDAGFTNEGGVDGTVRYLTNVTGLWLLSESLRHWQQTEDSLTLAGLLTAAAEVDEAVPVFDAGDDCFTAPGDMPERIARWLGEHDLPVPGSRAALVRSILESLAQAYAEALATAERLTGVAVRTVHVVGGGVRNELLCQLTADRSGRPVVAGPVEATAVGNLLVQARAVGLVSGDLADLRAVVRASTTTRRYTPRAARR